MIESETDKLTVTPWANGISLGIGFFGARVVPLPIGYALTADPNTAEMALELYSMFWLIYFLAEGAGLFEFGVFLHVDNVDEDGCGICVCTIVVVCCVGWG